MAEKKVYTGTGHRKSSIARVRMTSGKGKITINGKDVNEYFPFPTLVMDLCQPLDVTNTRDKFDIEANVHGGGFFFQFSFTFSLVPPKRFNPLTKKPSQTSEGSCVE